MTAGVQAILVLAIGPKVILLPAIDALPVNRLQPPAPLIEPLNAINHPAATNVFSQPASIQGFRFSYCGNRMVHQRRDENSCGKTSPDVSTHRFCFLVKCRGVFVGQYRDLYDGPVMLDQSPISRAIAPG
jgi:hypothetical protein